MGDTVYPFYGGLPPHQKHSATSRAAAIAILETAETRRATVYRFLRDRGESGATDEQIQQALGLPGNPCPRRRELEIAGLVEDSGRRAPTSAGKMAVIWILSPDPEPLEPLEPLDPQGELFA